MRTDLISVGRFAFIFIFLSISFHQTGAQSLKRIAKSFEKSEYNKAKELLDKAIEKDSSSFGIQYFYSLYYLDKSQRQYDLDSARIHINKGLSYRDSAGEDQLDDWNKTEIAASVLDSTKIEIANLSFQRANDSLSVQSMDRFMELFPQSHRQSEAVFLRDSVAYEEAASIDSWQAYKDYMDMYPESSFFSRVSDSYESLLFQDKTRDGQLSSYKNFLKEFPKTPYRRESETAIFTQMTKSHLAQKYLSFISEYPDSHLRKRAADILYYISKYSDEVDMSKVLEVHPDTDSLLQVKSLENLVLTPVLFDGALSFMDSTGTTLEQLKYAEVNESYKCGNVLSEWLWVKSENSWQLVNRNGVTLAAKVTAFSEVGNEAIFLLSDGKPLLYHKSGFVINTFPISFASTLFKKSIAFVKDSKWGLMTFSGDVILQPTVDKIEQLGQFAVLENNKNYTIINTDEVGSLNGSAAFDFQYDDYEIIGDSLFLGFYDDAESLVNQNLEVLLPLEEQRIYLTKPVWYVKKGGLYYVYDKEQKSLYEPGFSNLKVNESWLALKHESKWDLKQSKDSTTTIYTQLDSVYFASEQIAFIRRQDTSILLFGNASEYLLRATESFRLLKSSDAISKTEPFVVTSYKTENKILRTTGEVAFEGGFDDVQYLSDSTIIIKSKGKYGIYHFGNGYIQKPAYDLISEKDGLAFLLKNNQIGCIDLKNQSIIPAVYQSRIERFGNNYLVSKNDKQGVLNASNKVVVPIEYEELRAWNDTTFWANEDAHWSLKTYDGQTILNGVSDLKKWYNYEHANYHIFTKEGNYGIIHPDKGILIPPMYNDIINLGTETSPLFFAEQHLEAADFFVVTYFDASGNTIKSQAYRSDEYELIYCDQ
ncbi:MAG: WG repeat-containing protein [Cyclobacteriaceae bacterium]